MVTAASAAVITRAGGFLSSAFRSASMSLGSSSVASGLTLFISFPVDVVYDVNYVVKKKPVWLISGVELNVNAGARTARSFEYGRTHVVRPKGRHLATIVWIHGLGDTGARYVC